MGCGNLSTMQSASQENQCKYPAGDAAVGADRSAVGKGGEGRRRPKGTLSTKIEMIQKSCKINRLSDGGAVCLKHSPSAL